MSEIVMIEQSESGSVELGKPETPDVTQGITESCADLSKLVTAADSEKAAWKAYVQYLMRSRQKNPVKDLVQVFTNDIQRATIGDITNQLTEVDLELADLEQKAKAGDKKAAKDIAYFLEMQTQLQEQLGQASYVPQEVKKNPQSLLARIVGYIDSKVYRLWLAVNAPINAPLEALRSRALHEYENVLKASGKWSLLGLRPTLWVIARMRQNSQALADQIEDMRTATRYLQANNTRHTEAA
jgi:hypothetical protein